jgi:hypothetical protein
MDILLNNFLTILRQHQGREAAITSSSLVALMHLTDARTIRKLAHEARRLGRPICGDAKGYYWAANDAEFAAELAQLKGRALDMIDTYRTIKRGWREHGEPMQSRLEL